MLAQPDLETLRRCVNAKGNGADGASITMENGDFVAITHWPTMWGKMLKGTSAQAENDRKFYRENIPMDTQVLIRITSRKVVKKS